MSGAFLLTTNFFLIPIKCPDKLCMVKDLVKGHCKVKNKTWIPSQKSTTESAVWANIFVMDPEVRTQKAELRSQDKEMNKESALS